MRDWEEKKAGFCRNCLHPVPAVSYAPEPLWVMDVCLVAAEGPATVSSVPQSHCVPWREAGFPPDFCPFFAFQMLEEGNWPSVS